MLLHGQRSHILDEDRWQREAPRILALESGNARRRSFPVSVACALLGSQRHDETQNADAHLVQALLAQ